VTLAGDLHVHLDAPLPGELAVGGGTALFVAGWCHHPEARIRSVELVVNGEAQPVAAQGMPRIEVLRALERPDAYASGFWGTARVAHAPCDLRLRAVLEGGGGAEARLATIPAAPAPPAAAVAEPAAADGPLVAVCMATYEPAADLFARQLDSLRAQTHRNWVCVISDDCSDPAAFAAIEAAVAGDPRFVVSRSPARLGFYRNFERALAMTPAQARYVAMSDQDDAWYPDKLETLLARLGGAKLVYSDARIVDRRGEVVAESYWERRANNHRDMLSLLVANSVTGAASLFPRDLLDDALPFPPAQFMHFHDHWVALTALALGDIAYVDRPLYDYVQHGEAVVGHASATLITALRERLARLGSDPRERVRKWRMHYFVDVERLVQLATILRMRCGDRMSAGKRRALERFTAADRSLPAVVRLWARGARDIVAERPETLGAEWTLAYAFAWRRLLGATASRRPRRRLRLDAMPPTRFAARPGRQRPAGTPREIAETVAPLDLAVRDDAPPRVNVLVPAIDLEHLFAGYIAKFNLARRLSERGLRVRIVTVDPVPPLPPSWRRRLESYAGLAGLLDRVEVIFGRETPGIEVSRQDRFVATTWPTAHVAAAAVGELGGERFLYLIQEYEPFTFPMGTHAALANESYGFAHRALFSTELLRDYFRRHGLGVYAAGAEAGDRDSASFQNAITAIEPATAAELAGRTSRRLLFYARPEPHAARNMFDLGVLAIDRALARGDLAGWELHGIGAIGRGRRIELGGGAAMEVLRRADQSSYARILREHDLGLALMYTPHPSLVPIEMASSGMLAVTNTFENKTADALSAISPNLIAAAPTVEGIAGALGAAAASVGDVERRARGSAVRWSRDWDESFGDALMTRVLAFLEP
jgi:glycosyltransferase involved in cell wall biosynthesis